MPIEFTTTVDYKTFKDYYNYSPRYKYFKIVLAAISILTLLAKVVSLFLEEAMLDIFAICLLALNIAVVLQQFILSKMKYKDMAEELSVPKAYSFYAYFFEVELKAEYYTEHAKYYFDDLTAVYETKKAFLLLLDDDREFIIAKKDLLKEQNRGLSNLLQSAVSKDKFKSFSNKI